MRKIIFTLIRFQIINVKNPQLESTGHQSTGIDTTSFIQCEQTVYQFILTLLYD